MSIRVRSNPIFLKTLSHLRQSQNEVTEHIEKLSSGKRVNRAKDDAAGMSMASKLSAFTHSQRVAARNANDGISFIQTAEGGLEEISNILVRLRELSVQAGSDTVGESERGFLNKEYQQLTNEIDRIAEAASFNGTNVINGEKGVLNFQVGPYAGEEHKIMFDTEGTHADTGKLGVRGTGVESKDDALESISSIDEAINQVSGQRADLGAIQNRLHHAVSNIENSIVSHDNMRSVIEDVDVADSAARLATANLKKLSAERSLGVAMDLSKTALKLIE